MQKSNLTGHSQLFLFQLHDYDVYMRRMKELHSAVTTGRKSLADLKLDPEVLGTILQHEVFQDSTYSEELLTDYGRLHAIAGCQNFNDTSMAFSFALTIPRLLNPYPVYSTFQTGFLKDDKCYKVKGVGRLVMENGKFYDYNHCPPDFFGLCSETSFQQSSALSCLNMNSENCSTIVAECSPYNLIELESGVLVTSTSDITAYDRNGHLLTKYTNNTAFVKWDNITYSIVVDGRVIVKELVMEVDLKVDYVQAKSTFFYPDRIDLPLLDHMTRLNEKIDKNDDEVDLQFEKMSYDVFSNTLKSYFSIIFDAIFAILFIYLAIKAGQCCVTANPAGITNPRGSTAL